MVAVDWQAARIYSRAGVLLRSVRHDAGPLILASLSDDGARLALKSETELVVWDLETGAVQLRF